MMALIDRSSRSQPLGRIYDERDRLETVTQPWGGTGGGSTVVRHAYDVQDHLIEVTDANGTVTHFTYSDRDLVTEEVSEVSGTTTFEYNEHGDLVAETDGRGVRTERQVDAAGRTTLIDYPGADLDVRRFFDDPAVPYSRGRQTAIERDGGRVEYAMGRGALWTGPTTA